MDDIFFTLAFFSYFTGTFAYIYFLFWKKIEPSAICSRIVMAGAVCQFLALALRMQKAGHFPVSNMFESLSFFSWLIAVVYIFVERRYKLKILGPFVIGLALTMIAIASVLPRDIEPLVPALQSNWLALHVAVTFAGEAAFAISYVAALLYLVKPRGAFNSRFDEIFVSLNIGGFLGVIAFFITALLIKKGAVASGGHVVFIPVLIFAAGTLLFYFSKNAIISVLPSGEALDEISYRMVCAGLPTFTLGAIVFGAIWASRAWGSYWSWDPKEVWALITWFIYAIYLHMRYRSNLQGAPAAYITVLGFMSTLFTYFGVNYLLSGLHSYGRF